MQEIAGVQVISRQTIDSVLGRQLFMFRDCRDNVNTKYLKSIQLWNPHAKLNINNKLSKVGAYQKLNLIIHGFTTFSMFVFES